MIPQTGLFRFTIPLTIDDFSFDTRPTFAKILATFDETIVVPLLTFDPTIQLVWPLLQVLRTPSHIPLQCNDKKIHFND